MTKKPFAFKKSQRFRVINGQACFYATAGQIREGIGQFGDFNLALQFALLDLEESHKTATGLVKTYLSKVTIQLDLV